MENLKQNKPTILFLAKLGILCAVYFLWFSKVVWQLPIISTYYGHFVHYTMLSLTHGSVWVLNLLGYQAEVFTPELALAINNPVIELAIFFDLNSFLN